MRTIVLALATLFITTVSFTTANSDKMSVAELKVYNTLYAAFENFDFDASCNITQFQITKVSKGKDPVFVTNKGGDFNGRTTSLIQTAKAGDKFIFDNIKTLCNGDIASRELSSLIIDVK